MPIVQTVSRIRAEIRQIGRFIIRQEQERYRGGSVQGPEEKSAALLRYNKRF